MSSDLNSIKNYMIHNKQFMEEWINILLVWTGGRNATLIETANWANFDVDNRTSLETIFNFVELLNDQNNEVQAKYNTNKLFYKHDKFSLKKFPRYFITSERLSQSPDNDKMIGKLLEMYCYNDDYSNVYVDRLSFKINANVGNKENYEIFVEVCEEKSMSENLLTYYKNRVERMNNSMKKINFDITFQFEYHIVQGIDTLYSKVVERDLKFIKDNYFEYYNLVANYGSETLSKILSNHLEDLAIIDQEFNLFNWIIWLSIPFDKDSEIYHIPEYIGNTNNHIKLLEHLKTIKFPNKQSEAYKIIDNWNNHY